MANTHIYYNIIVLMGKPPPAEGERPIALMPMLYRVWARIRKNEINEWDVDHRGPWDAAIKGSSELRAAILSAFQDEVAASEGQIIIKASWDMGKFYDNIDIKK